MRTTDLAFLLKIFLSAKNNLDLPGGMTGLSIISCLGVSLPFSQHMFGMSGLFSLFLQFSQSWHSRALTIYLCVPRSLTLRNFKFLGDYPFWWKCRVAHSSPPKSIVVLGIRCM